MVPEETEILVPVKVRKMVKRTNDVLVPVFEQTQKFVQLPGNSQIEGMQNLEYQTKTAPIIKNTTYTPVLPQPTINQLTPPIEIQANPISPVTTTMTTTTQVQAPASSYTIASNPAPISAIQNIRTEVPPLSEAEINQILNQANLQTPPTTVQTEIQNYDIPSYQPEVFPQMEAANVPQTTQITSVPQTQFETISSPVQYDVQNFQVESSPVTTITQEVPQPISIPTPIPAPIPTTITTTMPTPMPAPVRTTITTTMPTPIPAPVPTTITTSMPTPVTAPVPTTITTTMPTPVTAPVPTTITTSIPTPVSTPIPIPAPAPIIRTPVAQPLPLTQTMPVKTYSVSSIRPVPVTRVQAVPQPTSSLLVTNVTQPLPVPVARPMPITNYSVASVRPVTVAQPTYSVASVRPVTAVPRPLPVAGSVATITQPVTTYSVASVRPIAAVPQPLGVPRPLPATTYSVASVRPVTVPQPTYSVASVRPVVVPQPVTRYSITSVRPVAVPQPLPVATTQTLAPVTVTTPQPMVSAVPVQGARPVYSTVSIPVIR
jgi:hypothetical protein